MKKQDIKELVSKMWEQGLREGLSDEEIIHSIEDAIQSNQKSSHETKKGRINYTPMTDAEIKKAQELISKTAPYTPPKRETQRTVAAPQQKQTLFSHTSITKSVEEEEKIVRPDQIPLLYGPPVLRQARSEEESIVQNRPLLYGPPITKELQEMM